MRDDIFMFISYFFAYYSKFYDFIKEKFDNYTTYDLH